MEKFLLGLTIIISQGNLRRVLYAPHISEGVVLGVAPPPGVQGGGMGNWDIM